VAALLRAAPGERGQALLDLGGAEPERPGRGDRRQQRRGEIVVVRGQLDAAVGLGQPEGARVGEHGPPAGVQVLTQARLIRVQGDEGSLCQSVDVTDARSAAAPLGTSAD